MIPQGGELRPGIGAAPFGSAGVAEQGGEECLGVILDFIARFPIAQPLLIRLMLGAGQVERLLPGMSADQITQLLVERAHSIIRIVRDDAILVKAVDEALVLLLPGKLGIERGGDVLPHLVGSAGVMVADGFGLLDVLQIKCFGMADHRQRVEMPARLRHRCHGAMGRGCGMSGVVRLRWVW